MIKKGALTTQFLKQVLKGQNLPAAFGISSPQKAPAQTAYRSNLSRPV
jgi:hypothetical protein